MDTAISRLKFEAGNDNLPFKEPFRVSGYVFHESPETVVTVSDGQNIGRGEAAGVYYLRDTPETMLATSEEHRAAIESGLSREELRNLLPPGGACNALDCALWELESKRARKPAWQLAGISSPRPLLTTFTVSANDPAVMAQGAKNFTQARAIKLKLTGELDLDIERVRAVRASRPDVWLGVDANQGYTRAALEKLLPVLHEAHVSLLEQPCARGCEAEVDGIDHSIPIAADESVLDLDEAEALTGRFDVVNIKLDKPTGLIRTNNFVVKWKEPI
jgi:L-alanine-DL-glutamate epimerase-like enolase superfamily enzyme